MYRSSILITQLELPGADDYKTIVMHLINCLVSCSEDIWFRHSMRSELVDLDFINIMDDLLTNTDYHDLIIQIEDFELHRTNDEEKLDLKEETPIYDLFSHLMDEVRTIR